MKSCAVCLNESDASAETCPHCGEASWADADRATPAAEPPAAPPPVSESEPQPDEVEGAPSVPETPSATTAAKGRKGRRA